MTKLIKVSGQPCDNQLKPLPQERLKFLLNENMIFAIVGRRVYIETSPEAFKVGDVYVTDVILDPSVKLD